MSVKRVIRAITRWAERPHESRVTAIVCNGRIYTPDEWRARGA